MSYDAGKFVVHLLKGGLLVAMLLSLSTVIALARSAEAQQAPGVRMSTPQKPHSEQMQTSDALQQADTTPAQEPGYTVGMTRTFLAFDAVRGERFVQTYEVRLITNTVEIWVQRDLGYYNPDGSPNPVHPDARAADYITPERLTRLAQVTQEQIIPVTTDYSGAYADRDGTNATLPAQLGLPADYFAGPAQRLIILVSNIRDTNFYNPMEQPTGMRELFRPAYLTAADRNIITIDTARWNELVGAPRYTYEAAITRAIQRLIQNDADADEATWVRAAGAEFAVFLNGFRPTPEAHGTAFSDKPENSLTIWGDQGAGEIEADAQQAYWFFLYMAGRLQEAGIGGSDQQFLRDVAGLTSDPRNGMAAIDAMLTRVGAPFDGRQLWRDFRIALLYGGTSDAVPWGTYISQYIAPSGVSVAPLDLGRLRRNLGTEGYSTPGAPSYGSDYIEIGWSPAITAGTVLSFTSETALPTAWTVIDANDAGITSTVGVTTGGDITGNVLYSGHTDLTDNFLIFSATVPVSGNLTLSYDTLYNIEQGVDFAFTQATTDTTGATGFVSLPITGTSAITTELTNPIIGANLPGFTGVSGSQAAPGWVNVAYDLTDYAGQEILLAFRYSTDATGAGSSAAPPPAGWYLQNIMLGDTAIYIDDAMLPAGAQSIWQARGQQNQFLLDIVTFADNNGDAVANVSSVSLDASGAGTFNLGSLLTEPGFDAAGERAVALVSVIAATADDLIGKTAYVSYTLTGLPPSILASDAFPDRAEVFPGSTFDFVTVINGGSGNVNIPITSTITAHAAMPIPEHTALVDGSIRASAAPDNVIFTQNLQSVDSGLPAEPGVYWFGTVADTVTVSLTLRASPVLTIGTAIMPSALVANAAFDSNPSQTVQTSEKAVRVVSPLALSTAATLSDTAQVSTTTILTYTLINTDIADRPGDFGLNLPEHVTLVSTGVQERPALSQAQQLTGTRRITVPSFMATEQVAVITAALFIEPLFMSDVLQVEAVVLQPDSNLEYVSLMTEQVVEPLPPELSLSVDCMAEVSPGTALRCDMAYANHGLVPLTNASMTVTIPLSTTFNPDASDPRWQSVVQVQQLAITETYMLELGDLAAGASGSATFAVTVSDQAPAGQTLYVEALLRGFVESGSQSQAETKQNTTARVSLFRMYMPAVFGGTGRQGPADTQPDLVGSIRLDPDKRAFAAGEPVTITAIITNTSTTSTTVGFWVDLLINPAETPSVNTSWDRVCGLFPCYGITWAYNATLDPGESIELTSSPNDYEGEQTVWRGWFVRDTTDLYLLVDSWNPGVPTGLVQEKDETNNLFHLRGLEVTGTNPRTGQALQAVPELPPRPAQP